MRGGSRVVEKLPNGSRERLQELRPQRGSSPALGSGAALPERALAACSARGGLPAPRDTLPGKSGRPGDFSRLLYQRTQLRSGWAGRACREAASPAPAEGPAAGHWAAFASQDARHTGLPRPVGQKARARRRGGGLNGGGVRGPPGRGLHGGGVRGPAAAAWPRGGWRPEGWVYPQWGAASRQTESLSSGVFIFSADIT